MGDRERVDASVCALVVATQLELDKEKHLRLSETNKTRRGLQCLEEKQRVDREDGEAAMHALVVAIHQDLAKEREMRLAETTETRCSLQSLEGRLRVDRFTALTVVMENSIEKERIEREKIHNDIKTQINNIKQELTEERHKRENDTSWTESTLSLLSQASETSWSTSE